MLQWCSSCQIDVRVLSGKNNLIVCQQCGCEVNASDAIVQPLQTVVQYESLIDLNSGLAVIPGQYAEMESWNTPVAEVPLATARFMPVEYYEEESRLAEEVANLDERWSDDQLLERICNLEQTILLADSVIPAEMAASMERRAELQLRFDRGHVATPEQIRAQLERLKSGTENSQAGYEVGPSSVAARSTEGPANDSKVALSGNRSPRRGASSRTESASTPSSAVSEGGNFRIDSAHSTNVPVAKPLAKPIGGLEDSARDFAANRRQYDENSRPALTFEAKQITCIGLGTAWFIQMLIGVVLLSNGPLAIWSFWLVAETVGTICLARVTWYLLSPAELGSTDYESTHTSRPLHPVLINRDVVSSRKTKKLNKTVH